MLSKSKKAKGTALEKWVVRSLEASGIWARRQPGSGIYSDFPHDAEYRLGGQRFIVECKSWRKGWRTGDAALGEAEVLVIKADRHEPRVYMQWDAWVRLLKAAQAGEKIDPD